MLGNKGFKLPCGEYILEEELQNALKEYVFSNERKDEKPKSSEEFFKHLEGEEITLKPSDVKVLDIDEKNKNDAYLAIDKYYRAISIWKRVLDLEERDEKLIWII